MLRSDGEHIELQPTNDSGDLSKGYISRVSNFRELGLGYVQNDFNLSS